MNIREINAMRGPNYWSVRRQKLIVLLLDLEEMEKKTPDFVSDSWEKVKDPKTRIKELMTKYRLGSISNELKINNRETTQDMKFTFERVNCLGACALAPVITVNNKYYGQNPVNPVF